MSFVFVCWHSRKWWPPIRGGTLWMALLWLEKVKWNDFFCKKSISYTNCQQRSKKQGKTPPKKVVFLWTLSHWLRIAEMRDPKNRVTLSVEYNFKSSYYHTPEFIKISNMSNPMFGCQINRSFWCAKVTYR